MQRAGKRAAQVNKQLRSESTRLPCAFTPQPTLENGAACDNHFQNSGILFSRWAQRWLLLPAPGLPLQRSFHACMCPRYPPLLRLLARRGKYWLGIRTACEPLFHSAALASYAPMMNQAIDELVGKMQAAAVSGEGGRGVACCWWGRPASCSGLACSPAASTTPPLPPTCQAGICVSELLKAMSMDVIGTTAFG